VAETAIIVAIPEAEPLIELFRRHHTEDGRQGVPSHVTLLYPFTDTSLLAAGRVNEVAEVIRSFSSFEFSLASVAYFPTTPRVLYLQPDPETPFRAMTRALVAAFPEHRPYNGEYVDSPPHATIAIASDQVLADIERTVLPSLPVAARATEASLIEHDDEANAWRLYRRLPLS
jgi:2'-5' RNA ligase